jgi:hypothetical protein
MGKYLALPANIRLWHKKLSQTNTLAYSTVSGFLLSLIFLSNTGQPTQVNSTKLYPQIIDKGISN